MPGLELSDEALTAALRAHPELLGREALRSWAEIRVEATEREIRQRPQMHRQGEKNSAGTRNSGK